MKKGKNMTENIADKEMSECKLCPRNCKKNRKNKEKGYCLMTDELCVARAALHFTYYPEMDHYYETPRIKLRLTGVSV